MLGHVGGASPPHVLPTMGPQDPIRGVFRGVWYDIQEGPIPLLSGVHPGTPSRSQPDARARVLRAKPEVPYFYAKRQKGGPGDPSGGPPRTPLGALAPPDGGPEHPMLTGDLSKGGYRYYHDVGVRMHHHIITLRI